MIELQALAALAALGDTIDRLATRWRMASQAMLAGVGAVAVALLARGRARERTCRAGR